MNDETDLHVCITFFDGSLKEHFMTFEEYDEMASLWDQEGVKKIVIEVLENSNVEG